MRVYDCFPFYNEFDILDVRLAEVYEHVDKIVLVEATQSHSGRPKPLYFAESRQRYQPFMDKIVHVVVDDFPETDNSWVREKYQREQILRGMADSQPDDWIMVSDVDEIPRADFLRFLRETELIVVGMQMPCFHFRFNYMNVGGLAALVWGMAVRRFNMTSPNGIRNGRFNMMKPDFLKANAGKVGNVMHAGWHFSYLGDDAHVRNKLENYAHREYARPDILDAIDIDRFLASGEDFLHREGFRWQVVPLTDYFPAEVYINQERYRHLIAAVPG